MRGPWVNSPPATPRPPMPAAPPPPEAIRMELLPELLPIAVQGGIVDTVPVSYIELMVNDPNGPDGHFTPIPLGKFLQDMEDRIMAAIRGAR